MRRSHWDSPTTDRCLRERSERRLVGVRPELVRRNVLAVEKTAAELEASEEFQRLEARIAELREEVEHLSQSLDDADAGTPPAESAE